jgi:hypothetical protein
MDNRKKNGNPNLLTEQQEAMRQEVVDLELRARYWKAQFEIRDYTLKAEKIQPEYDAFLEESKKNNEAAQKRFEEAVAELKAKGGNLEPVEGGVKVTQEMLDINPDLVTEGIEVGDEIPQGEEND